MVGDLGHNCLNLTKSAVNIDYFWALDGSTGTLVGLVKRPDGLELRLATWTSDGRPPAITREMLPLSMVTRGNGWVDMGPLNMSAAGCTGTVNGTDVSMPTLQDANGAPTCFCNEKSDLRCVCH